MEFKKPNEIRKSFDQNSKISKKHIPVPKTGRNKRIQRTNLWPGSKLNYQFLEQCKETVIRVKHPTNYYQKQGTEYRVSVMRWSRGAYVDIRMYQGGSPKPMGILLHQDVICAILPDLIAAVRKLEFEDEREPDKKAKIEVIKDDAEGNV